MISMWVYDRPGEAVQNSTFPFVHARLVDSIVVQLVSYSKGRPALYL